MLVFIFSACVSFLASLLCKIDERHICPLQLEVIRRALKMWSNPGDLVFSPFMGIGSEGFVAIQEGRRFVGSELKRSYFEQACRNLQAATEEQKTLFG